MAARTTILLIWMALVGSPAQAWDGFGHMEVAQLAWNALTPSARDRASQLLRLNPQYVAWTEIVPPDKRDQIAFLRAAISPDFIRGAPG